MRILAIRGRNLASLAGDFEVRLDDGALKAAGVFAITGPTGSGKSTLLDAMCLALFDTTPRLVAAGGAKIGRGDEDEDVRISANDVRNLLRKGTGEGYAEVDFVGVDSETYTARWEVRRAHRSPSARFQKTAMSLVAVDSGEPLGGKKTEVLEEIEERIGLSFEQFRRSVLLAQGDFAAFLDANERERASLLQRITGTEIYSEISKRAFERAREEKLALAALAGQREGIALLTDEQRDAAAAKIESLSVKVASLRSTENAAREALAWFVKLSGLHVAEKEAKAAADAAAAASVEAVELSKQVEAVTRALPIRGKLENVDTADENVATAQSALDAARAAAEATAETEALRRGELTEAQQAEKAAEEAQRHAAPAIKKARELDTLLDTARSNLGKTSEAAATAMEAADKAEETASKLFEKSNDIERQRDDADEWLRSNVQLRPLAEQWDRWKERLTQFRKADATLGKLDDEREDLLSAEESTRVSLAELVDTLKKERDLLKSARSDAQRIQKTVAKQPIADLRDEEKRARNRASALQKLFEIATAVPSKVKAVEKEQRARENAFAKAEKAKHALERATEVSKRLRPQLKEAQRAVDRAVAAGGADEIRGTLEAGEPCPVCGSEEHPWATKTPTFSKLIGDAKKRVEELETKISTADRKKTEAKKEIQAQTTRANEAHERHADAKKELRALEGKWKRAHKSAGANELPDDARADDLAAAVEAVLDDAQNAHQEIEERLSEANELQAEAAQASEAVAEQQDHVDALDADHKEADKAHRNAKEALENCDREIKRLRQTMAEAKDALREPLEKWRGWSKRLKEDPDELAEECTTRVGEWSSHTKIRETKDKSLSELRPKVEAAQAQAQERRQNAIGVETDRAATAEEEARLATERSELLGGRPADQVEHQLQETLEAARRQTQAAREAMEAAANACATAGAAAKAAASALEDRETERGRAREALGQALEKLACNEETLRTLLEHDETWVQEQQTRLDEIKQAENKAQAVLKERSKQRITHEETNRPNGSEEDVKQLIDTTEQKLRKTQEQLVDEQGKLRADDQQREQVADLEKRIEEQEKRAEVWKILGDLIGSADGNRFRVFAQSLTLDILLRHANGKLRELTPRYSLERVPGEALALQIVDHDMGDEVRSTKSLSGGESFLVSLALALGLATLSSKRTQVESLFVDEGFGALDADSLETVISALDALHATGRQVGVISHVSTVAERVGIRVNLEAQGAGRSRVRVEAA